MSRWTDEQVEELRDAMWQLLDDMGERGLSVCLGSKAQARVAFEPFQDLDAPTPMLLAVAEEILRDDGYHP